MPEDKSIKLIKAVKELNIGMGTIVDFLATKGYKLEKQPMATLNGDMYNTLLREFAADRIIKEGAKQTSIGKIGKEQPSYVSDKPNEPRRSRDLKNEEILIKNTGYSPTSVEKPKTEPVKPSMKVIGRIDLNARIGTEKKEEQVINTKSIVSNVRAEHLSGPNIIGKIELPANGSNYKQIGASSTNDKKYFDDKLEIIELINSKSRKNIGLKEFIGVYKYFMGARRGAPKYDYIYENELEIFENGSVEIRNPFNKHTFLGIAIITTNSSLQIISYDFDNNLIDGIGNIINFDINKYAKMVQLIPGICLTFDSGGRPIAAQVLLCTDLSKTKKDFQVREYFDDLAPQLRLYCPQPSEVEKLIVKREEPSGQYDNIRKIENDPKLKRDSKTIGHQTIKIFLASSSELTIEREQFELFIGRENKILNKKGVFLELEIWEDFLDSMSKTRLQDEYNNVVKNCDIFIMLFFTKVGKYTAEEFENAFRQFKQTDKPKIYTYFKDGNIKSTDLNRENTQSLFDFQERLGRLGHYKTVFENNSELHLHFKKQLERFLDF